MFFHASLGHFVLVLLAFVVLGLVSSVLSQEIGGEERPRNDLFCVEWDVKPLLSQSVPCSAYGLWLPRRPICRPVVDRSLTASLPSHQTRLF